MVQIWSETQFRNNFLVQRSVRRVNVFTGVNVMLMLFLSNIVNNTSLYNGQSVSLAIVTSEFEPMQSQSCATLGLRIIFFLHLCLSNFTCLLVMVQWSKRLPVDREDQGLIPSRSESCAIFFDLVHLFTGPLQVYILFLIRF